MRKYTNPFLPTKVQLELRDAVKTHKIWFHLLEYGDPVGDGFHSMLAMAEAIEPALSKLDAETLRAGIKAIKEATHFDCWRKSYTKPINDAMDVILKRFPLLTPKLAVIAVQKALTPMETA